MKLEQILRSQVLYYVALVLMVINLLGYVSLGSVECIVIFGIATYAANYFTKNRSLDILAGLFVSNVVFGCGRIKEGFEDGATTSKKAASKHLQAAKEKVKDSKCAALTGDAKSKCEIAAKKNFLAGKAALTAAKHSEDAKKVSQ